VSRRVADRLADVVAATPLAERFASTSEKFLARRGADAALAALDGPALVGLARLLGTDPEMSGFLSLRPVLLERIASASPELFAERCRELEADPPGLPDGDLEGALDELRLLRRDEVCWAACHDLGGIVSFEAISRFLSLLAESITRRALRLAEHSVAPDEPRPILSVLAMGKLAGREFTYHSDLDLIFLYRGGIDEIERASRAGQRLIAYLTTMTGAGIAYPVDTRLRPSGRQGTLVTTFSGFERYQAEEAESWEHLALLRSRVIAGEIATAQARLGEIRQSMLRGEDDRWSYIAELRARVETERSSEDDGIPFKTGAGGLMDVDFLAGGALLERGTGPVPLLASTEALLREVVSGERIDLLLDDHRTLRHIEARTRLWCGRAVESLDSDRTTRSCVAELLEPGLDADALVERLESTRTRIRAAWNQVLAAGEIGAIGQRRSGPGVQSRAIR
jgi:glutamate-ammonia-ligase adenylyltransferase